MGLARVWDWMGDPVCVCVFELYIHVYMSRAHVCSTRVCVRARARVCVDLVLQVTYNKHEFNLSTSSMYQINFTCEQS